MQKQTDNHNLPAKLALRLHFLHQYHLPATANVLDCCMGTGKIWSEIRKEYQISQYWGVDLKPKKGRIKIDSAKILNQPGWKQDVIDVDTGLRGNTGKPFSNTPPTRSRYSSQLPGQGSPDRHATRLSGCWASRNKSKNYFRRHFAENSLKKQQIWHWQKL